MAGPWLTKFFWEMLWSGKHLVIGTPVCECIKSQQSVHFETVERVVVLLFVVCVCICVCMFVVGVAPQKPEEGNGSAREKGQSSCDLPTVSAGDPSQVPWKGSKPS